MHVYYYICLYVYISISCVCLAAHAQIYCTHVLIVLLNVNAWLICLAAARDLSVSWCTPCAGVMSYVDGMYYILFTWCVWRNVCIIMSVPHVAVTVRPHANNDGKWMNEYCVDEYTHTERVGASSWLTIAKRALCDTSLRATSDTDNDRAVFVSWRHATHLWAHEVTCMIQCASGTSLTISMPPPGSTANPQWRAYVFRSYRQR